MPISASDFTSFVAEGDSFLTSLSINYHLSGKWEREARYKAWKIYNDATYLSTQIFGISTSTGSYLLQEGGDGFLLEDDSGKITLG